MPDDVEALIKQATRPYWVPGVNGVALDAALVELTSYQGEMTLIVNKIRVADGFSFTIEVIKGE
jgi:hypothetical protein